MDMDQIRHFCAVVEVGTLARASELMHLTTGALSRSLKRLEEEIGVKLFAPAGRMLKLTDQGQAFFPTCKRLLNDFDASLTALRKSTRQPKILRIGTFEVFSSRLLVRALTEKTFNDDVLMYELTPGKIEDAVESGTVDIGITYVAMPRPGLDLISIGKFQMVTCVQPRSFVGVPITEIPFAAPTTSIGSNVSSLVSLDGWPVSIPRHVRYQFELLEASLEACRRGLCAIHVPEFIAASEGFTVIPLPQSHKPVILTCYLVKRQSLVMSESLNKLIPRIAQTIKIPAKRRK